MKIKKLSVYPALIAVVLIIGITTACATPAAKPEEDGMPQETQTGTLDDDTGNKESTDDEREQQGGNGAVGNAALNPDAESIFNAVLLGNAQFRCVSEGNIEVMDITGVPLIFGDDPYMEIWNFSVADLDRDGEGEVILFVTGAAGDMGGTVILHRIGGEVYGYVGDRRILEELKTDGTFGFSDPTGAAEGGIGAITDFSELGYTMDKISYGTGTHEGWDTFVVDHEPATEEEYFKAAAAQNEKPCAEWYEFTEENIKAVF